MELLVKDLGPEAKAKVEISGGKLSLSADLDSKGLDAGLKISVDTDYFFDKLAEKIPGVVDDAVIAILKQAVRAL